MCAFCVCGLSLSLPLYLADLADPARCSVTVEISLRAPVENRASKPVSKEKKIEKCLFWSVRVCVCEVQTEQCFKFESTGGFS